MSAYAIARKMALLQSEGSPNAFHPCWEMAVGTLMLMFGSIMLGFGRHAYQDVAKGITARKPITILISHSESSSLLRL